MNHRSQCILLQFFGYIHRYYLWLDPSTTNSQDWTNGKRVDIKTGQSVVATGISFFLF